MHTRVLTPKHGPTLFVRPLRHGDVGTVMAVFERLSEQSRRARFNGPKPRLSAAELVQLARVDSTRHVLVAYLESDPQPVAVARLVRDGRSAEIAFEVADEHHQLGIGSTLTAELSQMRELPGSRRSPLSSRATTRAAVALLRRILDVLDIRFEGPELSIRAALA